MQAYRTMNSGSSSKVVKQFKQIGGVDFELTVRDESTGYFGAWFCRECWRGGVKYELLPNVDDALVQAGEGAMHHHVSEHSLPDGQTE